MGNWTTEGRVGWDTLGWTGTGGPRQRNMARLFAFGGDWWWWPEIRSHGGLYQSDSLLLFLHFYFALLPHIIILESVGGMKRDGSEGWKR